MAKTDAIIGIYDHWGWAVAVAATGAGHAVDRRRLELIAPGLPKYPYHHDAQGLPLEEAERMVAAVETSVLAHAQAAFAEIGEVLRGKVQGIALRKCPRLPATLEQRLADYFARNNADSVLYRQAIAKAATARGWRVHWYASNSVFTEMQTLLQCDDLDAFFAAAKQQLGTPWTKEHKIALAAAIAATGRR